MTDVPPIDYVRTPDGFHIAYQVIGDTGPDVLFLRMSVNHLELQWEHPRLVRFVERLAGIGRLIMFDGRGHGLSDAVQPGRFPTFEEWALDAMTVMDHVGARTVAAVAATGGCFRAVVLAASHPDRVSSLVLCDGMAKLRDGDGYEFGLAGGKIPVFGPIAAERYPNADHLGVLPEDLEWYRRYMRNAFSPGFAIARLNGQLDIDVRSFLPSVQSPTLVLSTGSSSHVLDGTTRDLADRIEDATYVEVPGHAYDWLFEDPDAVADPIERFITGAAPSRPTDRVLATVLYTDIVASSARNVEVGDAQWRLTLDRLDAVVGEEASRRRGRVIKSLGDGHLLTFDGPGGAIDCASALIEAAGALGVTLRAGVHTGEVELRGDDIGGVAATVGRRICDEAGDNAILVSGVVPQLVAGSGIAFTDLGPHELKGVGEWTLHRVERVYTH